MTEWHHYSHTDIKKIKKEYYGQFYASKFDNSDEMGKFLERHSLLKLSQEETDNLNRPTTFHWRN